MVTNPIDRLDGAIASLHGVQDLLCGQDEALHHVDPNALWFLLGLILAEFDAAAEGLYADANARRAA